MKTVVIAAHRPLAGDPRFPNVEARGGETSVGLIRDRIAKEMPVLTLVRGKDRFSDYIEKGDVVFTWGWAAKEAREACVAKGAPYVLMVRWWRNVCPLPPGDLMQRDIDEGFRKEHAPLFDDAAAVVTNNNYSAKVLKRWYGVDALVSYVSVPGKAEDGGNRYGPIIMVTDNKDVDASDIAKGIASRLTDKKIVILNATETTYTHRNILPLAYEYDMDWWYRNASVLINPIYRNDGCGTGRTMMEAMRFGVPVIGTDRAGLLETGGERVSRDADYDEWVACIRKIIKRYDYYQKRARASFKKHDAEKELSVYVRLAKELT